MRFAPWLAAVIITLAGAAAFLLNARQPGSPFLPGAPAVVRPVMRLVEEDSPIVGPDGRLREALGIETVGGTFNTVLPGGTTLPASRILTFSGKSPGQREIRIHLLRGVSERAAENHSLGWYLIGPLPDTAGATSAGERSPVAVIFRVAGRRIELSAVDTKTHLPVPLGPAGTPEPR